MFLHILTGSHNIPNEKIKETLWPRTVHIVITEDTETWPCTMHIVCMYMYKYYTLHSAFYAHGARAMGSAFALDSWNQLHSITN